MTNKDVLKEVFAFSEKDAKKYNDIRDRLIHNGYIIKQELLDNDGYFKGLAILEKEFELKECCLSEKKIPDKDKCYPSNYTNPESCKYYVNGFCCCIDDNYCLFKQTKEHEELLKVMSKDYDQNKDKEFYDNCSIYYEDTIYGRIFSESYIHLNGKEVLDKINNLKCVVGRE